MLRGKKADQGRRKPTSRAGQTRTFSYYGSADKQENTLRRKDKPAGQSRAGSRLRLIPSFLAASVIVGSILFSLTLTARPVADSLNDQPPVYRPLSEYEEAAAEIIGGSLGNRTKLSINTRAVEQALTERYPELSAVRLSLPLLGRKPTLLVDISQPAVLLAASAKVYALDASGTAVSEASALQDEVKSGLPVLRDQSGLEIKLGRQAVTTETVSFVLAVKAQLEVKQLKISELTLPAAANELDIRINGLNYFIKTDTSGDARKQIGSFLAVRAQGVRPSEYIDVRVEEKAYYK